MQLPSGYWAICWPRKLAREAGIGTRESTGCLEREGAEAVLRRRHLEVLRSCGDDDGVKAARKAAPTAIALRALASNYLLAHATGELEGRTPQPNTVEIENIALLGFSGLVNYAEGIGHGTSLDLEPRLITRWLEARECSHKPNTFRMWLNALRKLARYAFDGGQISQRALDGILAIRARSVGKPLAKRDGVPSHADILRLVETISPGHWQKVATLSWRCGLRQAEALALASDWIDVKRSSITVTSDSRFRTKSGNSRVIDGCSAETIALAGEVAGLIAAKKLDLGAYRAAVRTAVVKLRKADPENWPFEARSHAFRGHYINANLDAGVPVSIVAARVGHASIATTLGVYQGRSKEVYPEPASFGGPPPTPTSAPSAPSVDRLDNVIRIQFPQRKAAST